MTLNLNTVELFAGAGGLAIGMHQAGFKHHTVIEWDKNAVDTLVLNKSTGVAPAKHWNIFGGDVHDFDFKALKDEVGIVMGGPPCQPFSMGGKHKGKDDRRNLWPEAIRAVREIRPNTFVFENVKGLLRPRFANWFQYVVRCLKFPTITPCGDEDWQAHDARLQDIETDGSFDGLRYNVIPQLVNAADYGVPQRRERVILVGTRSDIGVEFHFPHATHSENALLYDKWVTGEYWEEHKVAKAARPELTPRMSARVQRLRGMFRDAEGARWQTVRDAISDLPRIGSGQTSKQIANHFLNPGARSYKGHTGSPWDEPAKALKAGDHGVPGGENTLQFNDGSVRYFSVRECARLQTFPDTWTFSGSWTESMRQLGNAVPAGLAKAVGDQLHRQLKIKSTSKAVAR